MVRQVFASERVKVDTNGDGTPDVERTRVQMAFGDHPDIPLEDDDRDGVTNALALGNKIRIVIDELLDGSTLEDIACADGTFSVIPSGTTPDDVAECAGVDRRDCTAVCTQISDVDNQPVGILDENEDGAPDELRFKEDIVHIVCDGVEMPLVYDGLSKTFWNPSGNQQIPAGDIGIGGLGPAIVVIPEGLRTGSTCTIEINDTVVDKDGNPVCAPEGGDIHNDCSGGDTSRISFGTQVFSLLGTAPPNNAMNVNVAQQILLQFNLDVDDASIAGNVSITSGGSDVPATIQTENNDAAIISIDVTGGMLPNTEYVIHVNSGENGLLEIFGGYLAEDIDITFTTGDAPPVPDAAPPVDGATPDV